RWGSLDAIYKIPSRCAHAAPAIASWIQREIERPVLVGPDAESEQWVAAVAGLCDAPFVVLEKVRRGDRDVEVSPPDLAKHRGRTPVLVDDIISTARTMIATIGHLSSAGVAAPVCIGIHAVFADRAHDDLLAAGASRIATCNTIAHPSNAIEVDDAIAAETRAILFGEDH
ncbi:MAG TPA: phosphoribosyltransferase family protein, partial [Kofleriaceae bacterium]|nr:phosphoribosyltransferase family protein [Kofleriaceae bacterium]